MVAKLALMLALVASAYVLDIYFGNHPNEAQEIEAESQNGGESNEHATVFLVAQTTTTNAHTCAQRLPLRNLQLQLHNKFFSEYYSIRNYQVLKAETATQTTPLISSYHYLVYQNHSFSGGEEPLS